MQTITTDKEILEEIMSRATAPDIVKRLNEFLEEERKKREHFYNEITEFEKAEFINGEIIIHSPVKLMHNDASSNLFQLINPFVRKNKLGFVGYEKIMITLSRNDYEPDICYFGNEKAKSFRDDQSLFPAPDFIVEVLSKSTEHNDRGVKFQDYQIHGVAEYWLVSPEGKFVEQYLLDTDGSYQLQIKASEGHISSKALKGFSISIESIFDKEKNMEELVRLLQG